MTLADEINRMIATQIESLEITSANPTHINHVIQVNQLISPDLESETGGGGTKSQSGSDSIPEMAGKFGPKDVPLALKATGGQGLTSVASKFAGGAAALAGPLAIAFIVPQMIPIIIDELTRPGGIMDKRFRIEAEKEFFNGMDRQTRQNTRIGDRQVIIQQIQGFRASEGSLSTNTLDIITQNSGRVLDIGLFDKAAGLSAGGP